jgi:hypothetical protein
MNISIIIIAYITVTFIRAITAIYRSVAMPFLRDALLIRKAFKFIIVTEFALIFILAFGAIAQIIASMWRFKNYERSIKTHFTSLTSI